MTAMNESGRASPAVILASLGAAGLFEVLTVLATQDKTVRAASPWQDDPYDAVVSLTQFAVPMLALVIALRLFAWRAPDAPDRERQMVRAAGAMTTLTGLTLVFEWAAVIGGAHAPYWNTWTSTLISGLVVTSTLTVAVTALLVRRRRPRGSYGRWRHDWLGDVVLLCDRIPVLRRWATPEAAAWVRRRAMTVFVTLSVLAAVGIAGSLAIGERWTNPLLIAWALIVETTSNLAFCVIGNAVAGFVARPPRTRARRVAETSVVAGCLAIQVTLAFRDALWAALGAGSLTSVPALVALTLGAGLVTSLATAWLLLSSGTHDERHAHGTAHPRGDTDDLRP
jgi:hypothetical protein